MTRLIFFDLYQTLLDVGLSIRNGRPHREEETPGWELLARELKKYKDVGADQLRALYDKRRKDFYAEHDTKIHHHDLSALFSQVLAEDLDISISREEVIRLLYEFRKATRGHLRLYPHIKETLERLSRSYMLSTASHAQACHAQLELRELGIESFFSYFVYTSDIGLQKSSPEFYKHALSIVGKEASECVMVGDNYDVDVLVPQQLGIRAVWIKNPITADQYIMEQDPPNTLHIQDIEKLGEVLETF